MTRARDLAAFVSNADGDIKFDTDTLFIDSSANSVGIGTSTPEASLLHLVDSDVVAPNADADDLVIEKTGDTGLSILSTTTGRIYFGDAANDDAGSIRYIHTDNSMRFETDDDERLRITSGGYLEATGGSQVRFTLGSEGTAGSNTANWIRGNGTELGFNSASGGFHWEIGGTERLRLLAAGGLTFNGDSAAANALDDYEEGTWTAQVSVGGSNVTTTNTDSTYVKIGRQVFLHGNIAFSVGTGTGDVNITGLPYSPAFSGYFRGIMANDFFDESGEFYTIVSTTGPKILPRVGPTGQSDGSRTLNGNDIKDNISARIYIGLIYQV